MGNVMAVTNGLGAVLEKYDYDHYGKPRFFDAAGAPIAQSAIGNPWLFNGHRYDSETGLYDYRTRHYDPRAGRFTSRDSIGTWGDEGNLGNGNAYAGNNPWSRLDPNGDQWCGKWVEVPCQKQTVSHHCYEWIPCPGDHAFFDITYAANPGGWGIDPQGGGGVGEAPLSAVPKKKPTHPPPPPPTGTCVGGYCGIAIDPSGGGSGDVATAIPEAGGFQGPANRLAFSAVQGGVGYSKLCPGHPSCPPAGTPDSYGSSSASMGDVGAGLGVSGGGATGRGFWAVRVDNTVWYCICPYWEGIDCTKRENWDCGLVLTF
jgi:RHS repeat-associated protein